MTISLCVCVRNDPDGLRGLLDHMKDRVDEIIIVDASSTDDTPKVAREYTNHVFTRPASGYCETDRQYSIDKATSDWILILDCDERLSNLLVEKLSEIQDSKAAVAYNLTRRNYYDKTHYYHHIFYPDGQTRLFIKNAVYWPDKIHSKPIIKGLVEYPTNTMYIKHLNPIFASRGNYDRYARIQAGEMTAKLRRVPVIVAGLHSYLAGLWQGIVEQAYLDGWPGIVGMHNRALYYYLVTKYHYQNKNQKKRKTKNKNN